MLKSLCVIPARSGSKGLKNKNILDLNGKPVIAYTIEVCRNSGLFKEIYVATDSEEYADIAISLGAKVPFLEPEEMAGDYIASTEPVLHFYENLKQAFDLLWCFQPTSPLRGVDDIINAYKIMEADERCDFVLGTTVVDPHYFHWVLQDNDEGMSELYFGKEILVDRSQLKDIVYRPNGAIKLGRTTAVCKVRNFFGDNIKRIEMPEERSIHIRNKLDLDLCKLILQNRGE